MKLDVALDESCSSRQEDMNAACDRVMEAVSDRRSNGGTTADIRVRALHLIARALREIEASVDKEH